MLSLVARAYDDGAAAAFHAGFQDKAPWFALYLSFAQFNAMLAPHALRHAQGQLQQEQTSFRALELRAKSGESRRLLRETSMSVADIGERLGVSLQSAFTRFFKTQFALPTARCRSDAAGL
ncbi:hypothetical protein [Janthinobacterium sp. RB2P8]|uniref:hypothetical protein n=1 Tax=Janthinobacterium sp. RB2P8 TaxID=3424191 RepID=UPI003F21ED1B